MVNNSFNFPIPHVNKKVKSMQGSHFGITDIIIFAAYTCTGRGMMKKLGLQTEDHDLRHGQQPMFFYTQRRKKGDGEDVNSEKVDGFWKIIRADISVKEDGQIIGLKNRLEFSGNHRSGTQWRMNEYRFNQNEEKSNITEVNRYVKITIIYMYVGDYIFSSLYFLFLLFLQVDMWVVCRTYMYRSKDDVEAWDEDWYFSSDDEEIKLS
nr:uncharacterized protein LOC112492342 [Ziziphus jujuba var. spinosa]